jgi:hypothetical protein
MKSPELNSRKTGRPRSGDLIPHVQAQPQQTQNPDYSKWRIAEELLFRESGVGIINHK